MGVLEEVYNTRELHFLFFFPSPRPDAGPTKRLCLLASPSLSTISRTFSLSFQSAFHLSITVLVRYRSLANI